MFDKNYVKELFKNHKAIIKFYDNITVLDFKNPNSNEYRIRFLFENDYYRLHISGDLGELTATNFNNMTYKRFDDFVRDVDYFKTKINCCNRPLYYYSEASIRTDVLKLIPKTCPVETFAKMYMQSSGEEASENYQKDLNSFFDELLYDYSIKSGMSVRAYRLLEDLLNDEFDVWDRKIGRRSTEILEIYMTAFKMAQEQLAKKNEE